MLERKSGTERRRGRWENVYIYVRARHIFVSEDVNIDEYFKSTIFFERFSFNNIFMFSILCMYCFHQLTLKHYLLTYCRQFQTLWDWFRNFNHYVVVSTDLLISAVRLLLKFTLCAFILLRFWVKKKPFQLSYLPLSNISNTDRCYSDSWLNSETCRPSIQYVNRCAPAFFHAIFSGTKTISSQKCKCISFQLLSPSVYWPWTASQKRKQPDVNFVKDREY